MKASHREGFGACERGCGDRRVLDELGEGKGRRVPRAAVIPGDRLGMLEVRGKLREEAVDEPCREGVRLVPTHAAHEERDANAHVADDDRELHGREDA